MSDIGRKLNSEELSVLTVLRQEGRAPEDRTIQGVATALERDEVDVGGVLSRLERDGLVSRSVDDSGQESWTATS